MALTTPRALLVIALAALAACEKPPKSESEVAQRVLANSEWMADVDKCPTEFMTGQMRRTEVADFRCSGPDIPGCYQRCKRSHVDSCYWLAYAVQQARVSERASETLYQRTCALGEPSGCVNRAAGMMNVDRKEPDVLRCTARTFERACEFDDIWGCSMSGLSLWRGLGVEEDRARAVVALAKACADPADQQHEACLAAKSMLRELQREAAPEN